MSYTNYSISPSTTYLVVNDYSFETCMSYSSGRNFTWVKIDHKNQTIYEYQPNELSKWFKVLIIIRNLVLLIPVFFLGFAYNIIVNRKFDPNISPSKILTDYIANTELRKTNNTYPLANIQSVEPKILPHEIWNRIFIEVVAIDNKERCNWSLISKEFYQASNSMGAWNSISNRVGFNFSQNKADFWRERAIYLNCHKRMKDDFPTLISLFKDPKSILALPTHFLTINKDVTNIKFLINVSLKRYGLLPLMKKNRIIRVVNNIDGESSFLIKCVMEKEKINKKEETWLSFSLNELSSLNSSVWLISIDWTNETTSMDLIIARGNFSSQLEMTQALLKGNTVVFDFYRGNKNFNVSLAKDT